MSRKHRKTYREIRQLILDAFDSGERTVNDIAQTTGLTWRTVNLHLIYLLGTQKIEPVFISSYVKIYRKKTEPAKTISGGRR
ncbi:hypothetical protein C4580_04755 [Candidatus Woesearchaeota archaeon]|nr:MAG: hypothetical protein C4580_04755 [Candidatus Woesearchaeota archaeon]